MESPRTRRFAGRRTARGAPRRVRLSEIARSRPAPTLRNMSRARDAQLLGGRGTALLPPPLTAEELARVPVLGSADDLLIDGLTAAEDDAFAAALGS